MLLVVSPNLAVDRVLEVAGLQTGAVHRTSSVLAQAGGKGSNVARVFRQFGGDVVVVGFVGGRSGRWIVDQLKTVGVIVDTVEGYAEESRTCTIIRDLQVPGHPTVINEESPKVSLEASRRLIERVEEWLPRVQGVVVTGSLSRGLPAGYYRELLCRALRQARISALDAAGAALQEGLRAHPTFVKPNAEEFAQISGLREERFDRIAQSVRRDWNGFASQTAVTLGEQGAVLVMGLKAWHARPPKIQRVNPIGCGDAFVAGYTKGLLDDLGPESSLRLAIAAATSDAGTLAPGFIDPEEVEALARDIVVRRI